MLINNKWYYKNININPLRTNTLSLLGKEYQFIKISGIKKGILHCLVKILLPINTWIFFIIAKTRKNLTVLFHC